ncbi:MAG: hypothetical protein WDN00_03505 [Limisphaerales bacterium]
MLNRSSGSRVGELVVANLPVILKDSPLFLGGPVQPHGVELHPLG